MNIINVSTWIGGVFLVWAVFSAIVVARMKFRDPKSWHGLLISVTGEFWDGYKLYKLSNTCDYWLALTFLPLVCVGTVLLAVVVGAIGYLVVLVVRVFSRMFLFLLSGETIYLTKDIKVIFTEIPGEYKTVQSTNSFQSGRSPVILVFLAWVVYQLFLVDYGTMTSSVTGVFKQVDWSGNLMILATTVVVLAGLVLAYRGIKNVWPTIMKAWNILHGKVCYTLPRKEDVSA